MMTDPEFQKQVLKKLSENDRFQVQMLKKLSDNDKFQAQVLQKFSDNDKFQAQVLQKFSENDKFQVQVLQKFLDNDKFQAQALKRLASQGVQLSKLEAFVTRQEDFNALIAEQFERLDQRLSQQQVLIENEIIERSKMLGEGGRMYTDKKMADHEIAFH